MPRHTPSRTGSTATPQASALSEGEIDRWADLIADGQASFPADLPPIDQDRLRAAVQRRRRNRLVRHIARAIALDLRRAACSMEVKSCSDVDSIRSSP